MGDGPVEHGANLTEGLLHQRRLQRSLVGKVLVDRRRLHAELVRQASHREGGGAIGFEDASGERHDFRGAGRTLGARRHAGHIYAGRSSRTNTGCFALMARMASSLELASTPSKNTPTSAFQRAR